jgi:hypothetical protein
MLPVSLAFVSSQAYVFSGLRLISSLSFEAGERNPNSGFLQRE